MLKIVIVYSIAVIGQIVIIYEPRFTIAWIRDLGCPWLCHMRPLRPYKVSGALCHMPLFKVWVDSKCASQGPPFPKIPISKNLHSIWICGSCFQVQLSCVRNYSFILVRNFGTIIYNFTCEVTMLPWQLFLQYKHNKQKQKKQTKNKRVLRA